MFMLRKYMLLAFGVLAGALLSLASCGTVPPDVVTPNPPPSSEDTIPSGDGPAPSLRVVMAKTPGSLDPALVSMGDTVGQDVVESLYIGLTRFDQATRDVTPALATDWTVSSDGLRWTFALREDVNWVVVDPESGEVAVLRPVVANDALFALWRACHPSTNAPHAAALFVIEGCREINRTDPALITEDLLTSTIRATAIAPDRFTVELEEQAAHFLSLTTMPMLRPVPPEAFAEEGAEWREAELVASSGAWVLDSHTLGENLTLVANPDWPFERSGNVNRVELRSALDAEEAQAAFQSSEADVAIIDTGGELKGSFTRIKPRVSFLIFSMDQFPTNDPRVRRGLAAAINRAQLASDVRAVSGVALAGFAPPGSVAAPEHATLPAVSFDPDFGRSQMVAAGYPNCQLFPRVTFQVDRSAVSLEVARSLARMWQENLICNNTRFEIVQTDMRLLLEQINTPRVADWQTRPQLTLVTWQGDYPDAANWLDDVLHCERGYVQAGRECEVVDELLDRAAEERGINARAALYTEISGLFFGPQGSQPIIPLYTQVEHIAVQSWVAPPEGAGLPLSAPLRFEDWQLDENARP